MKRITLAALIFTFSPLAFSQSAPLKCTAQIDNDDTSLVVLKNLSGEEYMTEGEIATFRIETYQNEDGKTYNVLVKNKATDDFVASSDVPLYSDSSFKIASGQSIVSIQCQATAAATK